MANDNTIKTFTALDIEKYHKGQLSAREMHAIEKAALDDPFLADALEGYTVPGINAEADIAELKKRLEDRTSRNKVIPITTTHKSSSFRWMRVAAMFILVAGAGFLVYKFGFDNSGNNNIAKTENPAANSKNDSVSKPTEKNNTATATVTDSISNTGTSQIESSNGQRVETNLPITNSQGLVTVTTEEARQQKDHDADGVDDKIVLQNKPTSDSITINNDYYYNKIATSKKNPLADARRNQLELKSNKQLPAKADSSQYGYKAEGNKFYGLTSVTKENNNDISKSRAKRSDDVSRNASTSQISRHNVFRGRVTDANNNPLPFANITNTVDNVGTYSDAKGNFTLISPDSVMNVQVRSVGFENNASVLVTGPRDNQVVMQEDNRSLGEVVINSNNRASNIERSRNNTIVHEEPEPADGWINYDIYVANNLKLPDTLRSVPTRRGYVELSFDVNKNGEPINITVDKSLCDSCDKEAIRVVKEGPKWKQKSRRKKRTSVTISF